MAKLEVKDLTISFRTNNGAVRAVRDISFSLNAGETLAIAGESGSGKSVTARAIMGILAGNAIVENGEIIYDGKDLLKIPEEEFHTLRGYKLAMVFQDPLSALNPIMKIGQQLTEAMILNNKERRADGKKRFTELNDILEKQMVKAGIASGDAKDKMSELKKIADKYVELSEAYEAATDAAVEAGDCCEEIRQSLRKRDQKTIKEILSRLDTAVKRIDNPYLQVEKSDVLAKYEAITKAAGQYTGSDPAPLINALDAMESTLSLAEHPETEPDFVAIAYTALHGGAEDPKSNAVQAINEKAARAYQNNFLTPFLRDVEKACRASADESLQAKKRALDLLKQKRSVFEQKPPVKSACYNAAEEAAKAVDHTIDRLSIEKDSASYVFRSSVKANLDRYFTGLKENPKERKRFEKDTKKHDKLVAQGKVALSVVPLNLTNLERAWNNIYTAFDNLIAQYEKDIREESRDRSKEAKQLTNFLFDNAKQAAHVISNAVARHHAIELMNEVGIPEPYKRFYQYPFEFSGGMRQRIVIAIALSANPDILICDEPTTALDVTIQAQILELINRLKVQRQLSVIFITHDLGVVANMADRLAVMYAGKVVEYGTADDVFYDPRHPYTWALLSSMPDLETKEKLEAIPGTPPDMIIPPVGDAFAARNKYAMQIDFEQQPPMFHVSDTHWAATWLLHPNAPKIDPPAIVTERIERMKRLQKENENKTEEATS